MSTRFPGSSALVLFLFLSGSSCRSSSEKETGKEAAKEPGAAAPAPGAAAPAAEAKRGAVPPPNKRERALEAGLGWLARHQQADGSWRAAGVDDACSASFAFGKPKAEWVDHYDTGSTALGLLAFVRAGWTKNSQGELADSAGKERVRPAASVARAIEWLHAQQNAQGSFTKQQAFLYNEALATLALAEHYAATKDASEREPAQRAVDFLVRAQRPSPSGTGAWGWRYASRADIEAKYTGGALDTQAKRELFDSDVSVTGWAVAALVAAERAGLKVDPESLHGASEFVRWCSARDGLVGYNDPKNAGLKVQGRNDEYLYHPTCMSSIGLRMTLQSDAHAADDFVEPAAKRISMDAPTVSADRLSIDYYYWLLGTQALASYDAVRGARYFQAWERALKDALLGLQERDPAACGRGAWLVPDRWSYAAGPIYTTAMALLALEPKH